MLAISCIYKFSLTPLVQVRLTGPSEALTCVVVWKYMSPYIRQEGACLLNSMPLFIKSIICWYLICHSLLYLAISYWHCTLLPDPLCMVCSLCSCIIWTGSIKLHSIYLTQTWLCGHHGVYPEKITSQMHKNDQATMKTRYCGHLFSRLARVWT